MRLRHLDSFLSVVEWDRNEPAEFNLYMPGVTIMCTAGKVQDRARHSLPRIPVEPLVYRARDGRPFGSSRISRPIMSITKSAIRTIMRSEGTADFYSAPIIALLGASEDTFGGAPRLRMLMSSMFGIPDDEEAPAGTERVDMKQISQASQEPHVKQLEVWAQLFAAEASIPVSSLGIGMTQANPTSAESYLVAEKVLDAARRSHADAIHPGYGFLSENPEFAAAVADAGLVWIGPTPESMRAMALKVEAKRLVAAAGVPLVPGAELAADASEADVVAAGASVGFPLLVKASAGGGGKGMRLVREPAELVEAVDAARNEAASAFGDPTVFMERFLERGRHVEVQVFGDTHGKVVHLFERECSIQRRHQKVVEESPSPGATPATLERMYAAAVAAASAIGYVGAGTVEFMVAGQGDALALAIAFWSGIQGIAETLALHPELPCPKGEWITDILKAN